MSKAAAADHDDSPARKTARKLSKAQAAHEKAEQRVADLRARLGRAEAKLAKRAQKLLLARIEPQVSVVDGAGEPQPAAEMPISPAAASTTPPAVMPARRARAAAPSAPGGTARRAAQVARPPRPRTSHRPGTGKGAETAPSS